MVSWDSRRAIAVVALVAALSPGVVAAQSAGSDGSTADAAPAAINDAAPAPGVGPAPVVSTPAWWTNGLYLMQLQNLRSNWEDVEYGIDNIARQQRQGVLNPDFLPGAANQYASAAAILDQQLAALAPPAQFAHVHQLHVQAGTEWDTAVGSAERWLHTGNQSALADAQGHFAKFDWLIGQALLELG